MLRYKFDVLKKLADLGYSSTKLRKNRVFGESTMKMLRDGKIVTGKNLEKICLLLEMQPGDILEYTEEGGE